MFKNYFKTAWRSLLKNKAYSALNIFGLATGMAVALIIGLWVYHQYSYDKFLPDYKQVYQVRRNFYGNGDTMTLWRHFIKIGTMPYEIKFRKYNMLLKQMAGSMHGLMVANKKFYINGGQVGERFS